MELSPVNPHDKLLTSSLQQCGNAWSADTKCDDCHSVLLILGKHSKTDCRCSYALTSGNGESVDIIFEVNLPHLTRWVALILSHPRDLLNLSNMRAAGEAFSQLRPVYRYSGSLYLYTLQSHEVLIFKNWVENEECVKGWEVKTINGWGVWWTLIKGSGGRTMSSWSRWM